MPKSSLPFDNDDYAPVAERITLFYEKYPTGRLITELVHRDERTVVFKALAFREEKDSTPAATGWAEERFDDGEINEVACLENTETSALGRALANLGFTASARRPSAEEMQKAGRARARFSVVRETIVPRRRPTVNASLQARADALHDVMLLLDVAARRGVRPARVWSIRARLLRGPVSDDLLRRIERRLRRWNERHAEP